MVIFWWASVAQENVAALLEVMIISWVVVLVSKRGKSYNVMLVESVLLVCVSVRSIVGAVEVSG